MDEKNKNQNEPIAYSSAYDAATHNRELLTWKTPDFVPHPKGQNWIILASTGLLALIVYALITGSATMAIVFILLGGMYYLTHNQTPKIIDVKITELGVWVADKFLPYNTINSFWVVYHPPFVRRLYLKVGAKAGRTVVIELNEQNPVEVRTLLAREVPEIEDKEEGFTDILIRLLRLQ